MLATPRAALQAARAAAKRQPVATALDDDSAAVMIFEIEESDRIGRQLGLRLGFGLGRRQRNVARQRLVTGLNGR